MHRYFIEKLNDTAIELPLIFETCFILLQVSELFEAVRKNVLDILLHFFALLQKLWES